MSAGELKPGLEGEWTRAVTPEMSARHLGSGDVGVLATPAMIAMMEGTALRAVQAQLAAGQTTVGYIVNIRHLAPTPVGRDVRVYARLEEVDGRKLKFKVEAYEGEKLIGDGDHVRVIIDSGRFLREAGVEEAGG